MFIYRPTYMGLHAIHVPSKSTAKENKIYYIKGCALDQFKRAAEVNDHTRSII